MAKKKKMKVPTVREYLENKKERRNLKRIARASRPLVAVKDSKGEPTKEMVPLGWHNMTPAQQRTDTRRRAKEKARQSKGNPPNLVRAQFCFLPGELGFEGPTEEEIKLMEETDPKTAKKMRHYNPLNHAIYFPHAFMRDDRTSMKNQWVEERERVKQQLLSTAQQQQDMVSYDPEGPTLDLENLTTAGDSNDANQQATDQ